MQVVYYAIRSKKTGLYLPEMKSNQRYGASQLEPNSAQPRLFKREHRARRALESWLAGVWTGSGNKRVAHPVPGRRMEDMEIVPFRLVELQRLNERRFSMVNGRRRVEAYAFVDSAASDEDTPMQL